MNFLNWKVCAAPSRTDRTPTGTTGSALSSREPRQAKVRDHNTCHTLVIAVRSSSNCSIYSNRSINFEINIPTVSILLSVASVPANQTVPAIIIGLSLQVFQLFQLFHIFKLLQLIHIQCLSTFSRKNEITIPSLRYRKAKGADSQAQWINGLEGAETLGLLFFL